MSVVFKPVAHVHRSTAAFGRVLAAGTSFGDRNALYPWTR